MIEQTLEYEGTTGELISEDDESAFNAPIRQFEQLENVTFKASSGKLTHAYKDYLRDFMLSREIYELVDDRLYRIRITSQKTQLFKDRENNYALQFEYQRAWKDEWYGAFGSDQVPDPGGSDIPLTVDTTQVTVDQTDVKVDQTIQ